MSSWFVRLSGAAQIGLILATVLLAVCCVGSLAMAVLPASPQP